MICAPKVRQINFWGANHMPGIVKAGRFQMPGIQLTRRPSWDLSVQMEVSGYGLSQDFNFRPYSKMALLINPQFNALVADFHHHNAFYTVGVDGGRAI